MEILEPKQEQIQDYWARSLPMSFIGEAIKFSDFAGKRVLELGCGAGIDSAEFTCNGAQVVSLDLTQIGARLTQDLLKEATLSSCVLQASALSLPFKQDTFDCVYSFGVLHHIPQIENVLAQIQQILKPGGQIMAMLYHKDSLLYAYSIIYLKGITGGLLGRFTPEEILSRYSERGEGCPYTKAYTKSEAKELFSRFFDDVQIEVHYNVIDLPSERKIKVDLPDKYKLGWHLIVKGVNE